MKKLLTLSIVVLLSGCGQNGQNGQKNSEQKLSSVTEAFGWKLGEKLLPQYEVKQTDSFMSEHEFEPSNETPPFSMYRVSVTLDRTIYEISALGFEHDDAARAAELRKAMVGLLTEKYGLRSEHKGKGDERYFYEFGTPERSASLDVTGGVGTMFSLTYRDEKLGSKAYAESRMLKEKSLADRKQQFKNSGL